MRVCMYLTFISVSYSAGDSRLVFYLKSTHNKLFNYCGTRYQTNTFFRNSPYIHHKNLIGIWFWTGKVSHPNCIISLRMQILTTNLQIMITQLWWMSTSSWMVFLMFRQPPWITGYDILMFVPKDSVNSRAAKRYTWLK